MSETNPGTACSIKPRRTDLTNRTNPSLNGTFLVTANTSQSGKPQKPQNRDASPTKMMILMTMQWDGDDDDEDYAAVTIVYLRGHRCTKRVTNQKNMKTITTVEEDEFR